MFIVGIYCRYFCHIITCPIIIANCVTANTPNTIENGNKNGYFCLRFAVAMIEIKSDGIKDNTVIMGKGIKLNIPMSRSAPPRPVLSE